MLRMAASAAQRSWGGFAISRKIGSAGAATRSIAPNFPVDLLLEIDRQARRLGVTRQAFIKIRIADSLQRS